MNASTALYLTDVISNIKYTFTIINVFAIILFIVAIAGKIACMDKYVDEDGKGDALWSAVIKKWPWLIFMLSISAVFPEKNTMYMMVGASYLQQSNLPSKVSKAIELKPDNYIKELSVHTKENSE